jgi:hypothetical protein
VLSPTPALTEQAYRTAQASTAVNKRPRVTPSPLGRSIAYLADRRRDPRPINNLRPYLNNLFPGAELELGEGFAVTGMKRSESFRRLSGGTQEQIAVRLAMGTLLAERGGSVPIFLDDALVYCDEERINMMFDALSRAAKNQQVVVLTCRSRSFPR